MGRSHRRRTAAPAAPVAAAPAPRPSARTCLAAAACGTVALLVYLRSLSPTVSQGDSGELIAVAHTLGIAHPPGYPLHALLGKLFTLIPVASVAWRVNLLSAVCDAGAAALLCRAAARASGSLRAGILAAGAFAFSPVVWPYAVTAEVFALNNLFAAALLDLSVTAALAASPREARRSTTCSAFLLGLGLTNHHTLILIGAPLLLLSFALEPRQQRSARRLASLAGAFALGLLPYAYLPIAATRQPPIAWGDTSTPAGLVEHLLRREYGTFRLGDESVGAGGQLGARLAVFAERLARSSLWAAPLLLAAALPGLRQPRTGLLTGAWLASLAFYVTVFAWLSNLRLDDALHVTVQDRFWQQAIVVAAACMGLGLAAIERWRGRLGRSAALLAAVALPAAQLARNAQAMDQSRNRFFEQYGRAILDSLPEGALLLITSDEAVGSVRALQLVDGRRPDVQVVPTGQLTAPWFRRFARERLPRLTLPAGAFTARQFFDANVSRFPVFVLNKVPWLQTLEQAYSAWPVGLLDQVLPKGSSPALEAWVAAAEASFARFDPGDPMSHPQGSWERYVATNYWKQCDRYAMSIATAAAARPDAAGARLVVRALEPLARRHPRPQATLFKNLGVAYRLLSSEDVGALQAMRRSWERSLELNPSDPDAPAMRALMRSAGAQKPAR